MAKLSAKGNPKNQLAPKKPSTRSKTGNAECSQAASTWQLSLRGKATATPETYQTLAKCRALASGQRKADAYGRTGKLSDQGASVLKGRLQSRFDRGLITEKSRTERLGVLLKQRAERGKAEAKPVVAKSAITAPKLAPGRGTEERKKASGILRGLRSQNNDGKTLARSIRDNAVHEWGRWGTGKTSVGNDPAFRAKRILNQSDQMRSSYESVYADSVIAADKLVTKTGKISVPGMRNDARTSFYSTMMPPEMAVKQRMDSLRASASTALNNIRLMKRAGIPETNFVAKPKATKDYRNNPLSRLRKAVSLK